MKANSLFWLASCTKLIASIACIQLVEKGVLELDEADQIEGICPSLKDIQVLDKVTTDNTV